MNSEATPLVARVIPVLGLVVFVGICWALSRNRALALKNYRLLGWGFGLQFLFALLVLKTPVGTAFFSVVNDVFVAVVDCTVAGSSFVFGPLGQSPGSEGSLGFFFAFYVLPTIIFFGALSALLYHLRILPMVVQGIAWVMRRTMRTSGAETLSAAANIFVGQTEGPLMIRPYLPRMTSSEITAVMTAGFATIAGGVMASYVAMLDGKIPGIAGHLLAASVMSAPAALLFAKIIVPEEGTPETDGDHPVPLPRTHSSFLDALAAGTSEGVQLAINVGAMLIAFLAVIALVDKVLAYGAGAVLAIFSSDGFAPVQEASLRTLLGWVMAPFAWLMGIPVNECVEAGRLLGIKTVANEFIAYIDLSNAGDSLSPRTKVILSYALCGFANLGSIGIQIGGLSILAPDRRRDLVANAWPALLAGTLAAFSTACFAAILV